MATAVGITDAPGLAENTDVLVVADPDANVLLWIPRDLWCATIRDRINRAFALEGHEGLARALAEHGLEIDSSLCVDRRAAERLLEGTSVEVPVSERLEFWYPADPDRPIEEGRRRISFEPPTETLHGERIHQWLGARYRVGAPGSDLERIARQQTMLKAMLEQGFDFEPVLEAADQVAIFGPALAELRRIGASVTTATFAENAVPRRIDGKDVLVR